jgi:CRP/FNR family transcriptional regulator, cyclic AMP receptor protein
LARAEDTVAEVRSAHQRALAPGEVVFDEGEPGDELFVVQSGEIELTRRGLGGARRVGRFGAGDFFGEISAVEGSRRTARAVAVGPARVLRLDRATLEAMCVSEPEIALRLIRGLAHRLLDAEHRLAQVDADEVLRPLVRTLLGAAQPDPRHGSRIPLRLRELAEASGLTLMEAHQALQLLFERGVLHLVDDCLVVPELGHLSQPLEHAPAPTPLRDSPRVD